MATLKELRPVMPILIGASVMLSLAMGVRQSFGLALACTASAISLAVGARAVPQGRAVWYWARSPRRGRWARG